MPTQPNRQLDTPRIANRNYIPKQSLLSKTESQSEAILASHSKLHISRQAPLFKTSVTPTGVLSPATCHSSATLITYNGIEFVSDHNPHKVALPSQSATDAYGLNSPDPSQASTSKTPRTIGTAPARSAAHPDQIPRHSLRAIPTNSCTRTPSRTALPRLHTQPFSHVFMQSPSDVAESIPVVALPIATCPPSSHTPGAPVYLGHTRSYAATYPLTRSNILTSRKMGEPSEYRSIGIYLSKYNILNRLIAVLTNKNIPKAILTLKFISILYATHSYISTRVFLGYFAASTYLTPLTEQWFIYGRRLRMPTYSLP